MTILCINTGTDQAELMNDGLGSHPNGRIITVADEPRVALLPQVDGASASRGNGDLGDVWNMLARELSGQTVDLDAMVEGVQNQLTRRLSVALQGAPNTTSRQQAAQFFAYLVGYSPRAGRFKAYCASWLSDFAPVDISDEFHVCPAPPGTQPSEAERVHCERRGQTVPPPGRPPEPPATEAGWVDLAKRIHRGRSLVVDISRRIPTGGPVWLTTLRHGQASQRKIHTFDNPAEFRLMVHNTMHPLAQLDGCVCGSGRRLMDCCIPTDAPCNCGSDKLTRDCCLLDLNSAEALEAFANYPELAHVGQPQRTVKAGRNDPCPCGSGAKYKRCCSLVAA